ncbi:MAG: hypothetical protein NTX59_01920 [Elusimicrobia bacterium]|nr:hypothetical protein [Elusimicrobiota bacterium]
MKKIMIAAILAWPFAFAGAQDSNPASADGQQGAADEPTAESVEAVQRPNSQRIMLELSPLRLSSKQESRLTDAIDKKAKEFDRLMKEYDKTSAEEKNLRYKVDGQRRGLLQINRSISDLIKDSLDEEQRQSYAAMLDAKNKSAPQEEPAVAETPAVPGKSAAPKPVRKHRVLKKKRLPTPDEVSDAVPAAQPDEAAKAAAEEEPGSVMVDKEHDSVRPPAHKKKRVLKKKAAVPAKAPEPKEDIMANEPAAGATPAAPPPPAAEEDAGSYP